MQCENWALVMLGLLAVTSSVSAAALGPLDTDNDNSKKDEGFTNCCKSKGIFES